MAGLLVGAPLGFVLHRGDFWMHSALREVLAGRPGPSFRACLLALAIEPAVFNGLDLEGLHLLVVPVPPVQLIAAALGGFVFGLATVGIVLGVAPALKASSSRPAQKPPE